MHGNDSAMPISVVAVYGHEYWLRGLVDVLSNIDFLITTQWYFSQDVSVR